MMVDVEKLIESMDLDELIGQMLCFSISQHLKDDDYEAIEEICRKTKAGGFFIDGIDAEKIKKATEIFNSHAKVPTVVAGDVEYGPGAIFKIEEEKLPSPMAWGASDDVELVEKTQIATAEICRKRGVHWSYSPLVDININMDNPVVNTRSFSDKYYHVAKIGRAAVRGLQKNGLMAASCKHFPGDGVDSRNQHFCTTINSLSKEEWMATFGQVYKEMIEEGVHTIMIGHIALPAFDEPLNDWVGYPPASISYNIQTKLLRETLGFEGCIVSDAMSMIGVNAAIHPDRVAVEFVKAGGDMLLFPLVEYFDQIKEAVLSGEIPMERIKSAVRRVITFKDKIRLFEDQKEVVDSITSENDFVEIANQIADKSITLIRNYDNLFPLKLKEGAKVLVIEEQYPGCTNQPRLDVIKEELEKRGYEVKSHFIPTREQILDDLNSCDLVLFNFNMNVMNCGGGSFRIQWGNIAPIWRGTLLRHPKCIFTSFGNPYTIFDYPYVKNYINAYSYSPSSQRAFVKAILGEIPFMGKSPVGIEGMFDAEV